MKNITEEHLDFKSFEKKLFELMCRIACGLIQDYLGWRDLAIMATRDKQRYRLIDSNRESTIKTVFGEVSYIRRYYYDRELCRYIFLLDEIMDIYNGFGLISENLAEHIVNECADKPFRKAAESISALTGQSISAQGAWNVLQRYGSAIEEQEARLSELEASGSVGHLGSIPSRVIFVEHDDVWISRQREKRRAPGSVAKGAKMIGHKLGKRPMRVGIAYTGWTVGANGRRSTANKISYASFGKSKTFRVKFGTLLNQRFDMDGVEQRITNGDGEPWIRTEAEDNDSILQLDPFHRSQAIIKAISDKDDRKLIFDALNKKDVDKALAIICELTMDAEDEKTREKLSNLYGYLNNNKDILLTWQERGIELPAPPDGIVYRDLGTQESNNCLLTQRMKHRRGAWSEDGGNNMAKILNFRGTIGLDAILGILPEPEPILEDFAEPLSASKAPSSDGKGYGADWLNAPMPFENAFKTNGQEVIRGMLRQKPLSSMTFI